MVIRRPCRSVGIWDYYANIAGRHTADKIVIDFADVTAGKRLPLTHPGAILRDDFLVPMKISVYTLAQAIEVPRSRVNDIVLGRHGITADTAFRLACYFGSLDSGEPDHLGHVCPVKPQALLIAQGQ